MPNWKDLALPLGIGAGSLALLGGLWYVSQHSAHGALGIGQKPVPPQGQLPTMAPAPAPASSLRLDDRSIVIGGRSIPVGVPVNHSLQFRVGEPGTHARRGQVTMGVVHFSGGEPRDGSGVWQTLHDRDLSVHFVIDRQGTIWQFADPATVSTAHCGSAINAKSWGVEVVDFGELTEGEQPPAAGRERNIYSATTNGRALRFGDFMPAQYTALFALANACSVGLGVPRAVLGAPWQRRREADTFNGLVGHLHLSTNKNDPGPRPLEQIGRQPGWRLV